jgi:hypothetical protein
MKACMKRSARLLLVVLVISGRAVFSQIPQEPVHAPDGGNREFLTSIAVPPLPNAPFSATVNTEWTRYLDNGATMTVKNRRLIARDGQGRVFQERRSFVSERGPVESRLTRTEISDPASRTIAYCDPSQRVCELRVYRAPAAVAPAHHQTAKTP